MAPLPPRSSRYSPRTSGKPTFCRKSYKKSESDEIRYYWGSDGFFHEAIKGQKTMDEVFANRLAHDLKDAFDKQMNREF